MSNLADPNAIFGGSGNFVDAAMKEQLYRTQTPFLCIGANPMVDRGFEKPQCDFYIEFQDGQKMTLALSHNDHRQRAALAVNQAMQSGARGVGPLYLGRFENKRGQPTWDIKTERQTQIDQRPMDNPSARGQGTSVGGPGYGAVPPTAGSAPPMQGGWQQPPPSAPQQAMQGLEQRLQGQQPQAPPAQPEGSFWGNMPGVDTDIPF